MNDRDAPPSLGGIHHISAICGDPQENVDFYVGLLGLRLVKRTVNFDDPGSYHLYYGDGLGRPGTLLTFFAWASSPSLRIARGREGTGQITVASLTVPEDSLKYWTDRLAGAGVDFEGPARRFDEEVVALRDPHGLRIELVARPDGGGGEPWEAAAVPPRHAVRGLDGASLCLGGYERTADMLEQLLGFRFDAEERGRFRFLVGDGPAAGRIDVVCRPEMEAGRMGRGTVHHIAWRADDDEAQAGWRRRLVEHDVDVTPILDRNYFRSIYFREPGDILFEIATDPPGFTIDEDPAELGTGLCLPPWLEGRRERIEARLPEIRLPEGTRTPPGTEG